MTRARDRLVLSGGFKETKADSKTVDWMKVLLQNLQEDSERIVRTDIDVSEKAEEEKIEVKAGASGDETGAEDEKKAESKEEAPSRLEELEKENETLKASLAKEKDDYLKVLYELKKQQDKLEMQMEAMNEKISQA